MKSKLHITGSLEGKPFIFIFHMFFLFVQWKFCWATFTDPVEQPPPNQRHQTCNQDACIPAIVACNHPPIWCSDGKNDCVSTIILSTLKNYKLDPLQGTSSPTLTMLLGNPCITFDTWEEPWNQREVTGKTTFFEKTTVMICHLTWSDVLELRHPISGHPSLQLLLGDTLILFVLQEPWRFIIYKKITTKSRIK